MPPLPLPNCIDTWISANLLEEEITTDILANAEPSCAVAGLTLPNSLTTMINLKSINFSNSGLVGNITDAAWGDLIELTKL